MASTNFTTKPLRLIYKAISVHDEYNFFGHTQTRVEIECGGKFSLVAYSYQEDSAPLSLEELERERIGEHFVTVFYGLATWCGSFISYIYISTRALYFCIRISNVDQVFSFSNLSM
jgi:hypothetical protein